MMKHLIPIAMLFLLAGTCWGTMWLYDDPAFMQLGSSLQTASFRPANVALLEIVNAPYFPLLGQGFYNDAIPLQLGNASNVIQIGSKGSTAASPIPITFGGHLEDNLRYAQSKSSLRIGQQGTWNTINTPGVL
jgi:hypothetical protein